MRSSLLGALVPLLVHAFPMKPTVVESGYSYSAGSLGIGNNTAIIGDEELQDALSALYDGE